MKTADMIGVEKVEKNNAIAVMTASSTRISATAFNIAGSIVTGSYPLAGV